jgi:hypothetical protein
MLLTSGKVGSRSLDGQSRSGGAVAKFVIHRDISNLRKDSFCKFVSLLSRSLPMILSFADFNIFTSRNPDTKYMIA